MVDKIGISLFSMFTSFINLKMQRINLDGIQVTCSQLMLQSYFLIFLVFLIIFLSSLVFSKLINLLPMNLIKVLFTDTPYRSLMKC
jgi:mannose/fructose/N-acetylgalactosamine-specific phosphotransferase system component IIC